jgi:hypothetical protein
VLDSAVFSGHRTVCAGALVKWGVKVSEVNSCKALIDKKVFEAFKYLTLYDLIYNDVYSINSLVYLSVHT